MLRIEIPAEFAVCACQQVQIELRGDTGGVVISSFDHIPIFANIDRDINSWLFERVDQDPRFSARAGAEPDQVDLWPEMRCDFSAMSIQNIDLGSRNVILRQFANFLKQRRAALVVKILAWQRAWLAGKTGDYVCQEIRTCRWSAKSGLHRRCGVH